MPCCTSPQGYLGVQHPIWVGKGKICRRGRESNPRPARNRIAALTNLSLPLHMEHIGGFEPPFNSFADCFLNHSDICAYEPLLKLPTLRLCASSHIGRHYPCSFFPVCFKTHNIRIAGAPKERVCTTVRKSYSGYRGKTRTCIIQSQSLLSVPFDYSAI